MPFNVGGITFHGATEASGAHGVAFDYYDVAYYIRPYCDGTALQSTLCRVDGGRINLTDREALYLLKTVANVLYVAEAHKFDWQRVTKLGYSEFEFATIAGAPVKRRYHKDGSHCSGESCSRAHLL